MINPYSVRPPPGFKRPPMVRVPTTEMISETTQEAEWNRYCQTGYHPLAKGSGHRFITTAKASEYEKKLMHEAEVCENEEDRKRMADEIHQTWLSRRSVNLKVEKKSLRVNKKN